MIRGALLLSLLNGISAQICNGNAGIKLDVCEQSPGSRVNVYFSGCCKFNDYVSIGSKSCNSDGLDSYTTADRWFPDEDFPMLSNSLHHPLDPLATEAQGMSSPRVKVTTNTDGYLQTKEANIVKLHAGSPVQTHGYKGELAFLVDYENGGHLAIAPGGVLEVSGAGKFVLPGIDFFPQKTHFSSELGGCKLTVQEHDNCRFAGH